MERIKILHVFIDDKFFDSVSNFFDNLSGIVNNYIFLAPKGYKFKYIKRVDKISIVHSLKEYLSYFSNSNIDVIYFHSLPYDKYYLFKYIDKTKIVIWWAWGYDIYYKAADVLPPLINLNLYKPETLQLINQNNSLYEGNLICALKKELRNLVKYAYYCYLQRVWYNRYLLRCFRYCKPQYHQVISFQVPFADSKYNLFA